MTIRPGSHETSPFLCRLVELSIEVVSIANSTRVSVVWFGCYLIRLRTWKNVDCWSAHCYALADGKICWNTKFQLQPRKKVFFWKGVFFRRPMHSNEATNNQHFFHFFLDQINSQTKPQRWEVSWDPGRIVNWN